jgi:hypothetical protein
MDYEPEQSDELVDLGTASTETKGGVIAAPGDEIGYFIAAGLSDD